MKQKISRRYQWALLAYLKQCTRARLLLARGMGRQALKAGMQTLDLAKLHEHILLTRVLPDRPAAKRAALIKLAGTFFTEAITPIEKINRDTHAAAVHLNQIVEILSQRTVELAASNLELKQEIAHRKTAEKALKKSERHYSELLEHSDRLQQQLRGLSRQILAAQEEERKRISRELHDVIAQTLTGINVRLSALKKEASLNTKGLDRNIAHTQRLVEKSVDIVHRFARELRPAVLDDLGLIPALHSFVKIFSERTHLRVHLKIFAGIEQLDINKRTMLYRVALESLNNVSRHAKAGHVEVNIQKLRGIARMEIKDDGRSFHVERVMRSRGNKRLGLLGMRERVEMFGGTFCVESASGQGTTIRVEIPFAHVRRNKLKKSGNITLKCP
ncbi:MAG: sensor histidine kinase [Methylacidiphilales bacterium]|nr:sensor histidine kinase [Candidatus Methylacidiphilales bacterium]